MEKLEQQTVSELKRASRKNNAPIWSRIAKSISKPVSLKKHEFTVLNNLAKKNSLVVHVNYIHTYNYNGSIYSIYRTLY